jgi:D-methionine transport system substrate-binding protein
MIKGESKMNAQVNKKISLLVATLIVVSALLTACATPTPTQAPAATSAPAQPTEAATTAVTEAATAAATEAATTAATEAATAAATEAATTAATTDANTAAPASGDVIKLKVGVSPTPHGEILKYIKDNLAAKEGLDLEIVEFSDYVQPNLALNEGQLDANYFQHVPYLDDFNKQHSTNIVSVVAVHIEPLGIYSKKIKSLSELADGAVVAIPNDATNSGRALNLLAANGLIKLKDGAGTAATVKDITDNPKKLDIKELEAAQLPRSLEDTAISVINGNYAIQAGFTPSKDALALEKGENNPYANILAVVKGHEKDAGILKLAKLLTSPEVKKFIEDKYQGSVIPAF